MRQRGTLRSWTGCIELRSQVEVLNAGRDSTSPQASSYRLGASLRQPRTPAARHRPRSAQQHAEHRTFLNYTLQELWRRNCGAARACTRAATHARSYRRTYGGRTHATHVPTAGRTHNITG